jgi:hypothetical protein
MGALTPSHTGSLASESRALLQALAQRPWSDEVYLAGSAALTLYLCHRPVRSLDLMAPANRLAGPDRRDLLEDLVRMDDGLRVETARDGFLHARSSAGVAIKIFYYPYPLIAPEEEVEGVPVASALDLGLMKIAAIISRGTRRDFVDLHLLCRELPLDQLLERSSEKFGHVRDFPLQALKGLADLSLTTGEPMPRLEVAIEWDEIEGWIRVEVERLGRQVVGLEGNEND